MNLRFRLLILIASAFVIRTAIACLTDLGNDEVYYFTYAVQPDWNHFDHPPLVGVFIRLFTLDLHLVNDLTLRLPALAGAAVNTWLAARCGILVKNRRTGWIAALLYNTSVYTSLIAGTFIIPDSVQLTFWLAALYNMLRVLKQPGADPSGLLLLTGLWTGLAILSKIHGIFLWLGFLGCLFSTGRFSRYRNPVCRGLVLTALIALPILFWNIANDFITWRFHGARVVPQEGIDLRSFAVTSIGQFGYNNPVNVCLGFAALFSWRRPARFADPQTWSLLLWCSLPLIIVTTTLSFFRHTLPHWSGPGFIGITLLSAAYLETLGTRARAKYQTWLAASFTTVAGVIATGIWLICFHPGTLNPRPEPRMGDGDFTLDMYGWRHLKPAVEQILKSDFAAGIMPRNAPLLTPKWFPGGHLFYYVGYPLQMEILGVGPLGDLHKFHWLNRMYNDLPAGSDAYYITPSNTFADPADVYGGLFRRIEPAGKISQFRNGKIARYWYVYRLRSSLKKLP